MADVPTRPVEMIDYILVVSGVVTLPAIILILAFVPIPDKNLPLFASAVSFVLGVLLGTIINNRFGASKGGGQTTDALSAIALKASE